jgi:hypothetical protein
MQADGPNADGLPASPFRLGAARPDTITTKESESMKRLTLIPGAMLCLTAFLGLAPTAALAQDEAQASQQERSSRFGIGVQSSWPAYGLSGIYDANDRMTAQLVLGALGSVTTISGRLLYHFKRMEKYNWYGFGTAGLWRHSYRFAGIDDSETAVAFGGGAGIELDWRRIIESGGGDFPPLYSTIDIGLTATSGFDHYSWSALTWGVGLHYRF